MVGADDLHGNITPQVLLRAYAVGIFPMAESADDPTLYWIEPEARGIMPLDEDFHVPKRLARTIASNRFTVTVDDAFEEVITACAAPAPGRRKTWINSRIRRLYTALYELGHCHSVEVRYEDRLVGGLYGVRLGAAFFGESMFSIERDASKVALVHLVARLRVGGFRLLDTQFITPHLARFGAYEVPKADYHRLLDAAVAETADFYRFAGGATSEDVLQSVSQTS